MKEKPVSAVELQEILAKSGDLIQTMRGDKPVFIPMRVERICDDMSVEFLRYDQLYSFADLTVAPLHLIYDGWNELRGFRIGKAVFEFGGQPK